MRTATVSANPTGTSAARLIRCLALSDGINELAVRQAAEYRDSPEVELILKAPKAPRSEVPPAVIGSPGTNPLVQYGVSRELQTSVDNISILGALMNRGARSVPLNVRVPVELVPS